MVLVDPHAPDQPLAFCNRGFCELTGYEEREVLGRNCRFLQGELTDPAGVTVLREAVAARADAQVEVWNYRKDGSAFRNSMVISPLFDPKGELLFYLGSQFDATARQEAEASRRAQQTDALGVIAAGIAHELANLMTVVMGSIEGLAVEPLSPRQTERLQRARWATSAAGRLTRQMLSLAHPQSLEAEPADLNALICDIDQVLGHLAGPAAGVELLLGDGSLHVLVDVGQFELALVNLVRNAADASGHRGRIGITTSLVEAGPRGLPGTASVEVAVSDAGSGMSAPVLARVTEPFFTTKARGRGTGLGLSMVRDFVERAGGALRIESAEGAGTTVRLLFPVRSGSGHPRRA